MVTAIIFIATYAVVGAVERAGLDQRIFDILQPFGMRTSAA